MKRKIKAKRLSVKGEGYRQTEMQETVGTEQGWRLRESLDRMRLTESGSLGEKLEL